MPGNGISTKIALKDGVTSPAQKMSGALGGVAKAFGVTESAVDKVSGKITGLIGAYVSLRGAMKLTSTVSEMVDASNKQIEAETKLQTIMEKRMGASGAQIESVKKMAIEQQKLGVVGDEVQLAGAQQLATFLNTSDALNTLIPAMNNLAVQQNGVNVTSESMVGLGNLMGKVMQGQTSALTRVGITFSEAQEKALKYGTEAERAAILAEVITDNVGEMNKALAETPNGKMQNLKNTFSDMKESLGAQLTPAVMGLMNTVSQYMPQIQMAMEGAGRLLTWVIGIVAEGIGWIMQIGQAVVDNWSLIGPILGLIGGAFLAYKVATVAITAAQLVYNATLYACPIVWIVGLIMLAVFCLYKGVDAFNEWSGASVSATGIIGGAIGAMVANVYNSIAYIYNIFAIVANFIGNCFTDPVAAVQVLFLEMANNVLQIITSMAQAIEQVINAIPGVEVDITSGLENFTAAITTKAAEVKDAAGLEDTFQKLEYKNIAQAAVDGYETGSKVESKVGELKELFSGGADSFKMPGTGGVGGPALDDLDSIANSTGKTADAVESTSEKLEWMKDIAEREIIDRTVFSSINVSMGGINNTVNNMQDLDGIPGYLANAIQQQMAVSAEGSFA